MNKKIKIIAITITSIIVLGVSYFLYKNNEEDYEITYSQETEKNETNNEESKIKEDVKNKIIVHVEGCVKNPGIVELEEGNRIFNAIEKMGGLTEEADTTKINLAYLLEDGMKIYIPSKNEDYSTTENENNVVYNSSSNNNSNSSNNLKININTANQAEFEKLPGIGEATALKIISYRKENGKFNTIEDLKNVKGIGTSKFEKIKDYIFV